MQVSDDQRPLLEIMNIAGDNAWMSVNDVHNLGELLSRFYLCRYHRYTVLPIRQMHISKSNV